MSRRLTGKVQGPPSCQVERQIIKKRSALSRGHVTWITAYKEGEKLALKKQPTSGNGAEARMMCPPLPSCVFRVEKRREEREMLEWRRRVGVIGEKCGRVLIGMKWAVRRGSETVIVQTTFG